MKAGEGLSLEEIRAFLEASDGVGFKGRHREEVYDWVCQTLRQVHYEDLKRSGRGVVRRYGSKNGCTQPNTKTKGPMRISLFNKSDIAACLLLSAASMSATAREDLPARAEVESGTAVSAAATNVARVEV